MNIPQSFLDTIIDFKWEQTPDDLDILLKIKLHKTKFTDYFYDKLIHYYYTYYDDSIENNNNDSQSEELLNEIINVDYFNTYIKLNITTFVIVVQFEFNGKTIILNDILEKYQNFSNNYESYYILNSYIIECPYLINLLKLINHSSDIQSINYNQYDINNPEYIKSRYELLSKNIKNINIIQKHQFILYNYLLSKVREIHYNTWNKDTYIKFKNLNNRSYILTNNNGCDIDLIMIMLMNDIKVSDNVLDTNLIVCRTNTSSEIHTKLKKMSKRKYTIIDSKKTLSKYTTSNSDIKNLFSNNIIVIECHLYKTFYNKLNTYYNNIEETDDSNEQQSIDSGNLIFNKTYIKDIKLGDLSGEFIIHSSSYYYTFSQTNNSSNCNLKDIIEICKYTINSLEPNFKNISTFYTHISSNIILKSLLSIVQNYYSDLSICFDNLPNNNYLKKIFNIRENIRENITENITEKENSLFALPILKYCQFNILYSFSKKDKDSKSFYFSDSRYSNLNKIILLKNNFKKHSKNFVYLDEEYVYNCLQKDINVIDIKCKPKTNLYGYDDIDGYFITNKIVSDVKLGNVSKAFHQLDIKNFKYVRNYLQSLNDIYEDEIIENDFIPEDLKEEYNNEIDRLNRNECIICMNPLKDGKVFLDCCHNVYCFECIIYSLSIKRNCPVCRKKIVNKNQLNCLNYNIQDIPENEAEEKYKTFEKIINDAKQMNWYQSLEDVITHIKNTNEDHKILINSNKCIQNNLVNVNKDYILRFQAGNISEVLKKQDTKFEMIGYYSNSEFKSLNRFRNSFDTNCILTTADFINYGNNYNYFNNVSDIIFLGKKNIYYDCSYLLPLLSPYKDNQLNIWILSELEVEDDEY